jgi:cytidylate kinase
MSLITITRCIGCGGMIIARKVAEELNIELYDDQRLQEEAGKIGIEPEILKEMDEKAPGFFNRLFSHKPEVYLDLMEAVIYEVARKGEGLILGHGAQFLLRDFNCALHVRIYSSRPFRIKHLMDQEGLSREAAEKMISKSDHERKGFLKFAFHKDWDDLSLYDLIINRDKLSAESASRLIIEVSQSQEIKKCSLTALDSMEIMSLEKKIEAAIIRNDISTNELHIEVPKKGVASITGWTQTQEEKDRVFHVVHEVPGVQEVKSEVHVVPMTGGV